MRIDRALFEAFDLECFGRLDSDTLPAMALDSWVREAVQVLTRESSAVSREVSEALAAALAKAHAAHPTLTVDMAAFSRHLATSLESNSLVALTGVHVEDLLFAFACGQGLGEALGQFEARFGADIDRLVRRGEYDPAEAADLGQEVRAKLLVGTRSNPRPQLLDYAGRGRLQGWVRVVTSRMVVEHRRAACRERRLEPAASDLVEAIPLDPGVEWLRHKYKQDVISAMSKAFEALDERDRRLLRFQLFGRLNTDDLGALFGVHRTTAARWAEKARQRLLAHLYETLAERLCTEEADARSLVALVRSSIDLSFARLLASR